MKIITFLIIGMACLMMLLSVACSPKQKRDPNLIGEWKSTADGSKLNITDKGFMMMKDSPEPEDYFVKGDTIYTSFEGNLPYTKYAIKHLDAHQLKLFTPDSTLVEFTK
ncbi:hypothetical protein HDF19_04470 [Mucilaginibacter sp. E4BP6]|jgi:hypothetical protein|uniref:hypothetical protein n=1 Tax=Mucilaginibacter sp. E4BP6 TaxID=2723089 RepID=UPI0015C7336A|nr:hypothetical protein [Mucilaginibacter sp. E4BP6]NYE64729.1 hypothetical protein [Mucilaginibacter sp. E4BP6]